MTFVGFTLSPYASMPPPSEISAASRMFLSPLSVLASLKSALGSYPTLAPAKDGKISRRSRMYETFSERLPNQTSPAAAAARAIETPWTFSFDTCSAASLVSAINFASDSDLNAE